MGFQQTLAVREYTVTIPELARNGHGIRIAHISDFHFRRWNKALSEARACLLATTCDLLLVTGDFSDLPQRWRHAADMTRRFFDGVEPRLGTYAVLGNHDKTRLAEQPDMPFRWLRDENVALDLNGTTLHLAGIEQCYGASGDLDATLGGIPDGEPVVLLAHYPSTAFDLAPGQVQLQLSGHTHGGQICLPRLGCVFTNDCIPTRQARGLHRIADTRVHVSAGMGVSGPVPFRYRVGCPAEITLLTLWSGVARPESSASAPGTSHKHRPVMELANPV